MHGASVIISIRVGHDILFGVVGEFCVFLKERGNGAWLRMRAAAFISIYTFKVRTALRTGN
jgi:hypothetical protein